MPIHNSFGCKKVFKLVKINIESPKNVFFYHKIRISSTMLISVPSMTMIVSSISKASRNDF